jgi:hypothetical protein
VESILDKDVDYILYAGPMDFAGYDHLTTILDDRGRSQAEKLCLVLVTYGGDANASYRIARALGHHYPQDFRLFVPDVCKSAGTLVTLGASELIISDRGELGPLDVQIQKKDELFEVSSGLDIIQSLVAIQQQVLNAFRDYLIELRLAGRMGTRIAAQLSSEMACKVITPIAAQIDPVRLGEHQRALRIAQHYGERLIEKFGNAGADTVEQLLVGYPSHSFVIDRKEARNLFRKVRAPNAGENLLELALQRRTNKFSNVSTAQLITYLTEEYVASALNSVEAHNEESTPEKQSVEHDGGEPLGETNEKNSSRREALRANNS